MRAPDDDGDSLRTPAQRLDDIAEYLAAAKQTYEEGNKAVLLMALHQCLLIKKPIPEWVRLTFIRAYESAAAFEIGSWEEAFGPAQEKHTQPEPRKKHAELRYRIALRIALRKPDEKIEPNLFATIAEELVKDGVKGVKATTVGKIYYERGGKELHEMIEPLLQALKRNSANL